MDFLPEEISQYIKEHTSPESEVLAKINKETWQKMVQPRMLSGHLQGRVLSMLSHMIQPALVLEIGTFTGYSALCLAEGLAPEGKVITIEVNEELESTIQKAFRAADMEDRIDLRIGNAMEIVGDIIAPVDLVFIDADKENYVNYYNLVIDKVRPGGYIIADNMLWSGKVLEEDTDEETTVLKEYNNMVQEDERVENVLFPIRDGLMICRKL